MKYPIWKPLLSACTGLLLAAPLFAEETIALSPNYSFEPCTVDVTNKTGLDISDYYENFPNPFAFYTNPNHPGVTLPGPDRQEKCRWTTGTPQAGQTHFVWNAQREQCILNGTYGYFDPAKASCSTSEPSKMSETDRKLWSEASQTGKQVYMTGIPGTNKATAVMIAFGHGVLNSPCGGVVLVKNTAHGETRYAAVLEVGTRAWSYEISAPANTYLAQDNYGGTCYIPSVIQLSKADIQKIIKQL